MMPLNLLWQDIQDLLLVNFKLNLIVNDELAINKLWLIVYVNCPEGCVAVLCIISRTKLFNKKKPSKPLIRGCFFCLLFDTIDI